MACHLAATPVAVSAPTRRRDAREAGCCLPALSGRVDVKRRAPAAHHPTVDAPTQETPTATPTPTTPPRRTDEAPQTPQTTPTPPRRTDEAPQTPQTTPTPPAGRVSRGARRPRPADPPNMPAVSPSVSAPRGAADHPPSVNGSNPAICGHRKSGHFGVPRRELSFTSRHPVFARLSGSWCASSAARTSARARDGAGGRATR